MPDIVFVLDESLSMESYSSIYLQKINSLISHQKIVNPNMSMSIIKFNDKITRLCHNMFMKDIPELTKADYSPSSTTALYDAIAAGIVCKMDDEKHKNRVIVIILTDGDDNESQKFTESDINNEIRKLRKQGWLFLYLGVGKNIASYGKKLGIDTCVCFSHSNTSISKVMGVCNNVINDAVKSWSTGQMGNYRAPDDVSDLVSSIGGMKLG